MLLYAAVDDVAELLLADLEADLVVKRRFGIAAVNVAEVLGDLLVEYDASDGAFDDTALLLAAEGLGHTDEDRSMKSYLALAVCHDRLAGVTVAV